MGQVSASSTVLIDAEPNRGGRSRGLRARAPEDPPPHYSSYPVLEGGQVQAQVATWKLLAKSVANQCCYLPVFMLTMYQ